MEIINVSNFNDGPVIIQPLIFKDERGYFFETFNESEFKEKVADVDFVQDNESKSSYGVLRGLHFQKPPYAQAKLVRVVSGAVFDVAVDIREGSPSYGLWFGAYLSGDNHRQFYIPRGFAHGFVSLSDNTVFQYKCDNPYNRESEGSIAYNDPYINIDWGKWLDWRNIKLSPKDQMSPQLREIKNIFTYDNTEV